MFKATVAALTGALILGAAVPALAKDKTIAVSWKTFQEERWKTDEAAIKSAVTAAGNKYVSTDAQGSAEKQAKDITGSMLKFYVDLGVIDKHEYLKEKQSLDNSNIQNIFFQLKTIRMAIEKIAEEINQGNTHPRLFEVFGQLQDKLTTVIKTQDRKSTRLNSSHTDISRMPSSA